MFSYKDSTIPLLPKSEISIIQPSSLAIQPGLMSDLVRNPEDRFSHDVANLLPGQWPEALSEYETELGLQEALGDTIDAAVACRNIGECYCGLDQFDKALNQQQRHLNLAR